MKLVQGTYHIAFVFYTYLLVTDGELDCPYDFKKC